MVALLVAVSMMNVAHRGLWVEARVPQNTVEAIKAAYEAGAKVVETDFVETDCGEIICLHDKGALLTMVKSFDRDIASITPQDRATLDLGEKANLPRPYRIPTLDEVLAVVPKDGVLQCEIKRYGKGYADTFDAAVKRARLTERNVTVSSFNLSALADFHAKYPKYETILLVAAKSRADIDRAVADCLRHGIGSLCPGCAGCRKFGFGPADAKRVRKAGLGFRVYGVNDPEHLRYAATLRATAFTCNTFLAAYGWARDVPGLRLLPVLHPPCAERIAEIAAALPEKPSPVSPDYDPAGSAQAAKQAAEIMNQKAEEFPRDVYLEYWTTGNRTHFQDWRGKFLRQLDTLSDAEAHERKGRFVPAIAGRLDAVCAWPSWVLPAHDHDKDNVEGRRITVDLVSSDLACKLAETLCKLDGLLPEATVARVRKAMDERAFEPYLRDASRNGKADHWWFFCRNNWSAVCHSCCVRAALAAVPDRERRARFVEAAERGTVNYLDGFAADGYCSEGMGYWNYGFGHFLSLGIAIRKATGGKADLFKSPKALTAMKYPFLFQLQSGISPRFADGGGNPSPKYLRWGCDVWPELKGELEGRLPIRSVFPDGQVWIMRTPSGEGRPLAIALKGGHNKEMHNHNDVGSYAIMLDGKFVTGDPGGEVYTARTFSSRRYESDVLNSFGHPVPRPGVLQSTGRKFAAKVVATDFTDARDSVTLDLAKAYSCKTLESLVRTVTLDRAARRITVTDRAKFSEPTAFDDPLVFDGDDKVMKCAIEATGGAWTLKEDRIVNPGRPDVLRRAVSFSSPVSEAEVTFSFAEQ